MMPSLDSQKTIMDFYLTEYSALRDSINEKLKVENQIFSISLGIAAAIVATDKLIALNLSDYLPFVALFLSGWGFAFIGNYYEIAKMGVYISTELRPAVIAHANFMGLDAKNVLRWDLFEYQASRKYRLARVMASFPGGLYSVAPPALTLLFYISTRLSSWQLNGSINLFDILMIFDIGLLLSLLFFVRVSSNLFLKLIVNNKKQRFEALM